MKNKGWEDYTVLLYTLLNRGLYALARQHCPVVEKAHPLTLCRHFIFFCCHLAIKAPPIGRFAPNFAQTLIGPWNTINQSVVLIGLYLVKICKTVCFEHNIQEFVVLTMKIILITFCQDGPQLLQSLVQQCATYYVRILGKKRFCIENSASCWSFLVCELQGPVCTTPMNFISISVMVWVQCQILN